MTNALCVRPEVDLRISGACNAARMVRTVCSKALSAILVASATDIVDPPTAFDKTSCVHQLNVAQVAAALIKETCPAHSITLACLGQMHFMKRKTFLPLDSAQLIDPRDMYWPTPSWCHGDKVLKLKRLNRRMQATALQYEAIRLPDITCSTTTTR